MRVGTNRKVARVLIGGHFKSDVRPDLFLVQAVASNAGKTLNCLLGEAINDLCAKYGVVRFSGENDQRLPQHATVPALATPGRDHVSLEPKACEVCSKSFLRVIGQEEKTCSACEVRLTEEARAQEASLAIALRDVPKSDRDRESKKSFDPAPSHIPLSPRLMTVTRGGGRRHVTEDRPERRRTANGMR